MTALDIAHVREEYMRASLDERDVAADPLVQFRRWYDEAVKAELPVVNAMILATADAEGRPSARTVLLKALDERGFVFYSNYASRKGEELAANPRAALLFYWTELERQVRIEGTAEKTAAVDCDAYFDTRPLGSRLAAHASRQSSVVPDRQTLERLYEEAERAFGDAPPRPVGWGGYRIIPESMEFWQGRANRLHDRLVYTKDGGGWTIRRLAP